MLTGMLTSMVIASAHMTNKNRKVNMIRKSLCLLAAFLLCVPAASAVADSVSIPADSAEIKASAFKGRTTITDVFIFPGVRRIGDYAFSECTSLQHVSMPDSIEDIGEKAFDGCPPDMLVTAPGNSYALKWAIDNNFDFNAETKYRALIIGNSYSGMPGFALSGPVNDTAAVSAAAVSFAGTPYDVTVMNDISADSILESIRLSFGQATENDVSFFYFSGHGINSDEEGQQGALLGNDGESSVTACQLRSALDSIPGRKIIIIETCYSGVFATGNTEADPTESEDDCFAGSFLRDFSDQSPNTGIYSRYFIITSSAADELSYETKTQDNKTMGAFTYHLVTGLSGGNGNGPSMPADINGNGAVTLQELYQYIRRQLIPIGQHVRVYPNECTWFGVFRQ